MTATRRYAAWFGSVAALLVGLALIAPAAMRHEVLSGVTLAVLLQGPLGWWALGALGTPRFTLVWGLGMLTRLATVALVAVSALPALGWAAVPALLALVAALMILLGVEAVVAAHATGRDSG